MFVFLVGVEVIEDDVKLAVVKAVFSFVSVTRGSPCAALTCAECSGLRGQGD